MLLGTIEAACDAVLLAGQRGVGRPPDLLAPAALQLIGLLSGAVQSAAAEAKDAAWRAVTQREG